MLLGSQTLGGAYSLARSTIGQMAVRIALQCSEADAHLILSEENTAARLLTRPGEAIYNDANGVYEGNHPFQVVWLLRRPARRLPAPHRRAGRRAEVSPARRPIVFEGNVLSDLERERAVARAAGRAALAGGRRARRGPGWARPWPSPSPPRPRFSARAAAICSWSGIAKRPPWA